MTHFVECSVTVLHSGSYSTSSSVTSLTVEVIKETMTGGDGGGYLDHILSIESKYLLSQIISTYYLR